MTIHDPGLMDFIEIVNNAHPMVPDNCQAIQWWIRLACSGFPIAPVSGLDLHRPMDLDGVFSTFIETDGDNAPESPPEASQALGTGRPPLPDLCDPRAGPPLGPEWRQP